MLERRAGRSNNAVAHRVGDGSGTRIAPRLPSREMARFLLIVLILLLPSAAAAAEREVVLRLGAESDSNPTREFDDRAGAEVGPKGTIAFADQLLAWPDGLLTTENQVGARWLPERNDWTAVWRVGGGLAWMNDSPWSTRVHAEFRGRSEAQGSDDLGITRDYERLSAGGVSARSWDAFSVEVAAGYAAFGYAADSGQSWHGPTWGTTATAEAGSATLALGYDASLRLGGDGPLLYGATQAVTGRAEYDGGCWLASVAAAATSAPSRGAGDDAERYLHESLELSIGGLLWGDAVGSVSGVLQRVDYDGAGAVVELAVEDEDRNQVSVAIEQPLGAGWGLEGRYQRLLQRQQAGSTAQNDFERHIAFVGLSWRSRQATADR